MLPADVLADAAGYLATLARSGASNTAVAVANLDQSPPAEAASAWLSGYRAVSAISDLSHNLDVARLSILQVCNLLQPAGPDLARAAFLVENPVQVVLRPHLQHAMTLESVRADPDMFAALDDAEHCARWAVRNVRDIRERFRTDFGVLVRGSWPDYLLRAAEKAFEVRADTDAEAILEMAGTPPSLLPYLAKAIWRGKSNFASFQHAIAAAVRRRRDDARADEFKLGKHQVLSLDDDAAAPLFEFESLFDQIDERELRRAEKIIAGLDPLEFRFHELIAEGHSARSAARILGISNQVYERFRKRKSRRTLKSVPKPCFSTRN